MTTSSRQSVPFFWHAVVSYLAPGSSRRGAVLLSSPWLREAVQKARRARTRAASGQGHHESMPMRGKGDVMLCSAGE